MLVSDLKLWQSNRGVAGTRLLQEIRHAVRRVLQGPLPGCNQVTMRASAGEEGGEFSADLLPEKQRARWPGSFKKKWQRRVATRVCLLGWTDSSSAAAE